MRNEAEERGDDKMIVYTCENCITAEVVCEVTVRDGMIPPKNCPYAILKPEFKPAHEKTMKEEKE